MDNVDKAVLDLVECRNLLREIRDMIKLQADAAVETMEAARSAARSASLQLGRVVDMDNRQRRDSGGSGW
jgi:hypothetical protein